MKRSLIMSDTIFLTGTIDYSTSNTFIQKLLELSAVDTKAPIWVLINSTGENVDAALIIINSMRECKRPVKTCCIGKACSSAGLILLAGPDGRYALADTKMMLHQPKIQLPSFGSMQRLIELQLILERQIDAFDQIVEEGTGLSRVSVEHELSYDHYFSTDEALAFGMIDEVIPISEITTPEEK
jgi:ATP-dependent Clp protease protease subunit